ncbi:hypothetical protein J6590_015822 [Homalodisca vitripennis]|nr:hypothetical protein J6590_015822 [Homalodisca vitripennis]
MCNAHSIIMYSCEQLVVASSLGAIAVSAALVAVLCCTRRPPKVGNTPLVLLLVGLLAIAATFAAAGPETRNSPMSHIPVETVTEPEDDGEDADDESPDPWAFPPRANRTYVTLEPALPGPFEFIEEELILGGRRWQPLRPIPVPQPRIRHLNTPGTPAVTITPVPRPSTSRDPATSQHNTSRGDSAFTPISSRSCISRGASCPCTAPITATSSTSSDRRAQPSTLRGTGMFIITIKVDIFQPLEGSCLACQQEVARRRSREFLLYRFLQEHTPVDCDRRALDAMVFLRSEFRETLWLIDHLIVNTSEHQILSIAHGVWRSVQVTMMTLLITVGERMMEASRRTAITTTTTCPVPGMPGQIADGRVETLWTHSVLIDSTVVQSYKITPHLDKAPRTSGQLDSLATLGTRVRYPSSTLYTFCTLIPTTRLHHHSSSSPPGYTT